MKSTVKCIYNFQDTRRDVSSQIVTKVIGPEGLEYFWRQLCHLNPLRSLHEGSRALSHCLLVGRNKWVLTVKIAACCPFFSMLWWVLLLCFCFYINTCSDDVATCKNNEQRSACFCSLTGKCVLFILLIPRPAACSSRHTDWTRTRTVQQRGDVPGFLRGGWGDTFLLKNPHSLKISGWWQRVTVTRTVCLFNLFEKEHWQSTNIFFFSSGMSFWLVTVDLQLGREKSHFKLHCRPVEIPEPWFSTPEIGVSYTAPLISISICK